MSCKNQVVSICLDTYPKEEVVFQKDKVRIGGAEFMGLPARALIKREDAPQSEVDCALLTGEFLS